MDRKALLALLIRYLRQPSTWQGLSLLMGSLAAYLGVPVEQATAGVVLVVALILVITDERPTKEVVKEALDEQDDKP